MISRRTFIVGALASPLFVHPMVRCAHAQTPATRVFVFAGQSNAQGYANRIQLNPVPGWAQTEANGWTGAPTVSYDTSVQYQHPTLENLPCLYNENNTGLMSGVVDAWGAYEGDNPQSGGGTSEVGSYGPELSFLAKYHADNPTIPIAAIKCVLGGSSIDQWVSGGSMDSIFAAHLSQAATRLTNAGISYVWEALIWMQGESGASTIWPYLNTPNVYSGALRDFITLTRSRTSSSLKVVIGRISNSMLADNIINPLVSTPYTADDYRAATNHRRDQQVLVAGDSGNTWWDNDNLPVLQSGDSSVWYHFQSQGYLAMGERAYDAYKRMFKNRMTLSGGSNSISIGVGSQTVSW